MSVTDIIPTVTAPTGAIDEVDRAVVGVLPENPRASYPVIAEAVGVSPGTVRNRVIRLAEAGLLRWRMAHIVEVCPTCGQPMPEAKT